MTQHLELGIFSDKLLIQAYFSFITELGNFSDQLLIQPVFSFVTLVTDLIF